MSASAVERWPHMTDEERRADGGCCVYGDCTAIGDHVIRGTERNDETLVFICATHSRVVAENQKAGPSHR